MEFNPKKFSLTEATTNTSTGKTSLSAVLSLLTGLVSCITFVYGCFIKNSEIITQSSMLIITAAGLAGYRKSQDTKTETIEIPSVLSTSVSDPSLADSTISNTREDQILN